MLTSRHCVRVALTCISPVLPLCLPNSSSLTFNRLKFRQCASPSRDLCCNLQHHWSPPLKSLLLQFPQAHPSFLSMHIPMATPQLVRRVKVRVWDFLLETKGCMGWGLAAGVGLQRLDREWPPGGRTHTQTPDRWNGTLQNLNSNTHTFKRNFWHTWRKIYYFDYDYVIVIMCTRERFHAQIQYILPDFTGFYGKVYSIVV